MTAMPLQDVLSLCVCVCVGTACEPLCSYTVFFLHLNVSIRSAVIMVFLQKGINPFFLPLHLRLRGGGQEFYLTRAVRDLRPKGALETAVVPRPLRGLACAYRILYGDRLNTAWPHPAVYETYYAHIPTSKRSSNPLLDFKLMLNRSTHKLDALPIFQESLQPWDWTRLASVVFRISDPEAHTVVHQSLIQPTEFLVCCMIRLCHCFHHRGDKHVVRVVGSAGIAFLCHKSLIPLTRSGGWDGGSSFNFHSPKKKNYLSIRCRRCGASIVSQIVNQHLLRMGFPTAESHAPDEVGLPRKLQSHYLVTDPLCFRIVSLPRTHASDASIILLYYVSHAYLLLFPFIRLFFGGGMD